MVREQLCKILNWNDKLGARKYAIHRHCSFNRRLPTLAKGKSTLAMFWDGPMYQLWATYSQTKTMDLSTEWWGSRIGAASIYIVLGTTLLKTPKEDLICPDVTNDQPEQTVTCTVATMIRLIKQTCSSMLITRGNLHTVQYPPYQNNSFDHTLTEECLISHFFYFSWNTSSPCSSCISYRYLIPNIVFCSAHN